MLKLYHLGQAWLAGWSTLTSTSHNTVHLYCFKNGILKVCVTLWPKKANTVRKSAYAALLKVSAQLFRQSRKTRLTLPAAKCISFELEGENYSKFKQRLAQMCRTRRKQLTGHSRSLLFWPYILLRRTDPIWWLSNSTRLADFSWKLFGMINGVITKAAPPTASNVQETDTSIWWDGLGGEEEEEQHARRRTEATIGPPSANNNKHLRGDTLRTGPPLES